MPYRAKGASKMSCRENGEGKEKHLTSGGICRAFYAPSWAPRADLYFLLTVLLLGAQSLPYGRLVTSSQRTSSGMVRIYRGLVGQIDGPGNALHYSGKEGFVSDFFTVYTITVPSPECFVFIIRRQ